MVSTGEGAVADLLACLDGRTRTQPHVSIFTGNTKTECLRKTEPGSHFLFQSMGNCSQQGTICAVDECVH